MKKAVVVGGSNGIGMAIAIQLIKKGYHIIIVDKSRPYAKAYTDNESYTFIQNNLLIGDYSDFEKLAQDKDIEVLMITAGFGRVADFEDLHSREIDNMMQVNADAGIQIVHCFYDRIRSRDKFYCGMMGSIAGLISSPMFSVYAASKAAVCRFIESVNIEIEEAGSSNRILNVSPGSIKGSRFNGGENNAALMEDLAGQITQHLLASDELFIPDYDETYKGVLDRYHTDAHAFGLSSYEYKKESGRVNTKKQIKVGYLSGTFDLFHVGHLNLLMRAKQYCDYLIVGVHPNASHKKKETFIPFEERCRIVGSCKYVDKVVQSCPEDMDAWSLYPYDYLFVGSDYKGTDRFNRYEEYFKDKGVQIIYFPYTKGTSSTQLRGLITAGREAGGK